MPIKNLFRKSTNKPRPGITFEEARILGPDRIVAIGDIHGRLDSLEILLEKLETTLLEKGDGLHFVLLGDYIDRGPSSCQVINKLLKWKYFGQSIFLMGNHERFLLNFLVDPIKFAEWLQYGGIETLISYQVFPKPGSQSQQQLISIKEELASKIPDAHLEFLKSLKLSYTSGDFMFVHAGVDPSIPLDKNPEEILLWIREPFLSYPKPLPKVIVHGHTISSNGIPEIRINRVGLDTGSYLNGKITAMAVAGAEKIKQ